MLPSLIPDVPWNISVLSHRLWCKIQVVLLGLCNFRFILSKVVSPWNDWISRTSLAIVVLWWSPLIWIWLSTLSFTLLLQGREARITQNAHAKRITQSVLSYFACHTSLLRENESLAISPKHIQLNCHCWRDADGDSWWSWTLHILFLIACVPK